MRRLAIAVMLLFAVAGCRDGSGSAPPADRPGTGVEQQLDDLESTLDSVESELDVVSPSQREARDSTRPIRWPGDGG